MKLTTIVDSLRKFRSIHQWIGIFIFSFMIISSVTGILLGWKKNVDLLQPPTQKGGSVQVRDWVSFEQVVAVADRAIDSVLHEKADIERLDARPDKGIIKVIYLNGFWEVQVDGKTGKVLSVAQRHSDWIEHIHDGSILGDSFKLGYTNLIGWGLLFMSITGFWLWLGPRRIRKAKNS